MLTRMAMKFGGVAESIEDYDTDIDYDYEHRFAEHEHDGVEGPEQSDARAGNGEEVVIILNREALVLAESLGGFRSDGNPKF